MATILMIEDDEKFARLMQKVLPLHGHSVIHANTALAGLDVIDHQSIDLVLLDMDLPDLDGKVVATTLRARTNGGNHLPIVAVTAQTDAIARRLALAFGCDGFIPKPVDTRKFPEQIAAYLPAGK
jgi:DNA-binding response OmpR family regulator